MDKLKQKFKDDPIFAVGVLLSAAVVATGMLNALAKTVESSAYAYRASKMIVR